ncbi:hypothetical protein C1I92_25775 [Jiangella anatolica]|uniref:M23ase beta-sheet core domain-containing protein n=1 Tax=Jiangella anatolica TaxID=2670374 RepID=A0A2W2B603_9ACTN|nr:hypothetical protein C1I92_25775 [Jiangella anatolica]
MAAAVTIACVSWGISSSTAAPDVRASSATPSVEEAQADVDSALAAFEAAQKTEQAAQQRAEQASQAAADARTAAAEATARAERARGESTDAATAAEQARETLGRLAAHAYMNNTELSGLMQLGIADPEEFQARSTGVSELMRVQDTVLAQAAESQANATDAASRADGHLAAAQEAATSATELSEQAAAALDEASSATVEAGEQLQKMRDIHAAAQRAAEEREAAENQPDRGDGGGDGGSTDTPPPSGNGVFQRPSTGPITSPYGMRVHPLTGVYKLHSGTDFGASCGTAVYAAYPGTVESTGYEGAYGNRIEIAHTVDGMDVTTTYNHLSAYSTSPGTTVAAGDLIGRVGTTGSSTGCHLHFEVLVNGSFTDPMSWLS